MDGYTAVRVHGIVCTQTGKRVSGKGSRDRENWK